MIQYLKSFLHHFLVLIGGDAESLKIESYVQDVDWKVNTISHD